MENKKENKEGKIEASNVVNLEGWKKHIISLDDREFLSYLSILEGERLFRNLAYPFSDTKKTNDDTPLINCIGKRVIVDHTQLHSIAKLDFEDIRDLILKEDKRRKKRDQHRGFKQKEETK